MKILENWSFCSKVAGSSPGEQGVEKKQPFTSCYASSRQAINPLTLATKMCTSVMNKSVLLLIT